MTGDIDNEDNDTAMNMLRSGAIGSTVMLPNKEQDASLQQAAFSVANAAISTLFSEAKSSTINACGTFLIGLIRGILNGFALLLEVLIHHKFGSRVITIPRLFLSWGFLIFVLGVYGYLNPNVIFQMMISSGRQSIISPEIVFFIIIFMGCYIFHIIDWFRLEPGTRHTYSHGVSWVYSWTKYDFFLSPLFRVWIEPLFFVALGWGLVTLNFRVGAVIAGAGACLFLRNLIDDNLTRDAIRDFEDQQLTAVYQQAIAAQRRRDLDRILQRDVQALMDGKKIKKEVAQVIVATSKNREVVTAANANLEALRTMRAANFDEDVKHSNDNALSAPQSHIKKIMVAMVLGGGIVGSGGLAYTYFAGLYPFLPEEVQQVENSQITAPSVAQPKSETGNSEQVQPQAKPKDPYSVQRPVHELLNKKLVENGRTYGASLVKGEDGKYSEVEIKTLGNGIHTVPVATLAVAIFIHNMNNVIPNTEGQGTMPSVVLAAGLVTKAVEDGDISLKELGSSNPEIQAFLDDKKDFLPINEIGYVSNAGKFGTMIFSDGDNYVIYEREKGEGVKLALTTEEMQKLSDSRKSGVKDFKVSKKVDAALTKGVSAAIIDMLVDGFEATKAKALERPKEAKQYDVKRPVYEFKDGKFLPLENGSFYGASFVEDGKNGVGFDVRAVDGKEFFIPLHRVLEANLTYNWNEASPNIEKTEGFAPAPSILVTMVSLTKAVDDGRIALIQYGERINPNDKAPIVIVNLDDLSEDSSKIQAALKRPASPPAYYNSITNIGFVYNLGMPSRSGKVRGITTYHTSGTYLVADRSVELTLQVWKQVLNQLYSGVFKGAFKSEIDNLSKIGFPTKEAMDFLLLILKGDQPPPPNHLAQQERLQDLSWGVPTALAAEFNKTSSSDEIKIFLGVWGGQVKLRRGNGAYRVVIKIEEKQVLINYPSLKCSGYLEKVKVESSHLTGIVKITKGTKCINGGRLTLRGSGAGIHEYSWTNPKTKIVDATGGLMEIVQ